MWKHQKLYMNCLSFKKFVNVKIKEILLLFMNELNIIMCEVYMRDAFNTSVGIVTSNKRNTLGYVYRLFLLRFIRLSTTSNHQKNNKGLYSEHQFQKNDSYCAAYCLYILNLTYQLGFKNTELILYYQIFRHY